MQIPKAKVQTATETVQQILTQLKEEFGSKESQLKITLAESTSSDSTGRVLTDESLQRIVSLLLVVPHGVAKMSHAVSGNLLCLHLAVLPAL